MNILQMKDTMTHFPLFFLMFLFFLCLFKRKIFAKTRMEKMNSFCNNC